MSRSRFPEAKPEAVDPAEANHTLEWNGLISKLGFCAVVIQMKRDPATLQAQAFCESLGDELQSAGLGHFDSSQWDPHIRHFFYAYTNYLAKALELLKRGLERKDLLEHSIIAHFDATERVWRQFHPGLVKS